MSTSEDQNATYARLARKVKVCYHVAFMFSEMKCDCCCMFNVIFILPYGKFTCHFRYENSAS